MKLSKQPVNMFNFFPFVPFFFYKLGKDGHHFVTGERLSTTPSLWLSQGMES